MRLYELTGSTDLKGIGIYSGRFQPPHKGHASVFDYVSKNNAYSFIATSDKTDPVKSPFSFKEKQRIMTKMLGIPEAAIVQVKNPYIAFEITNKFDLDKHYVVFYVSQKDMDENPRFSFPESGPALKKNGEPAYLQKWDGNPKPASQHGYIAVAPTASFDVLGKPMQSATEIRELFRTGSEDDKKQAFVDLYGKFDEEIYNLFIQKLGTNVEEDADNKNAEMYRRWGKQGKFIYSGSG